MLLHHFLEESTQKHPQKIALICREERLTYQEVNSKADQLAHLLRAQGVQRGDRVAIFLDNSPEAVIALFGILKADAVFLMLSPLLKPSKLHYILDDCEAKALITHTNKLNVVSGIPDSVPSLRYSVFVGDKERIPASGFRNAVSWDEMSNISSPCPSRLTSYGSSTESSVLSPQSLSQSSVLSPCSPFVPPASSEAVLHPPANASHFTPSTNNLQPLTGEDCLSPYASRLAPLAPVVPSASSLQPPTCKNIDLDLATIIYTSGSTGNPKGVMLTHLNMTSATTSITTYLDNDPGDIIIDVLPLSFDYGLYQVLMAFKFGGTVVLEKSFTYPYEVIKQMVKEKVTGFPGVPTIFAMLLQMEDLTRFDLTSLRYLTSTAASLPVEHIQRLRAIFPKAKLYSMYGLTECKRVSYLPPEELDRRPGSIGKGMPNEEIWIVDGNGNPLGPDVVGELVVRGSNVMRGYWKDPEATDRVLKPGLLPGEKVLYTGDFFRKDEEGFLYFVGRKDDMIKTRGERVSPKEVENAIDGLEGISEVAVIPIPDDILGQAIKAFVVTRNGFVLIEKDVLKQCKKELEELAVPKYIEFRKSLPKTSSGKIDKLSLKEEAVRR